MRVTEIDNNHYLCEPAPYWYIEYTRPGETESTIEMDFRDFEAARDAAEEQTSRGITVHIRGASQETYFAMRRIQHEKTDEGRRLKESREKHEAIIARRKAYYQKRKAEKAAQRGNGDTGNTTDSKPVVGGSNPSSPASIVEKVEREVHAHLLNNGADIPKDFSEYKRLKEQGVL